MFCSWLRNSEAMLYAVTLLNCRVCSVLQKVQKFAVPCGDDDSLMWSENEQSTGCLHMRTSTVWARVAQ